MIIKKEKKRTVPEKPPMENPKRKNLPLLGSRMTDQRRQLDMKRFKDEQQMMK